MRGVHPRLRAENVVPVGPLAPCLPSPVCFVPGRRCVAGDADEDVVAFAPAEIPAIDAVAPGSAFAVAATLRR